MDGVKAENFWSWPGQRIEVVAIAEAIIYTAANTPSILPEYYCWGVPWRSVNPGAKLPMF
jgi:hypothetical protein